MDYDNDNGYIPSFNILTICGNYGWFTSSVTQLKVVGTCTNIQTIKYTHKVANNTFFLNYFCLQKHCSRYFVYTWDK